MNEEISDGKCLQMQIRFGIRYQWILYDLTKFYAEKCFESCPLYFQNGNEQKSFKLKIIKAKPNLASIEDDDEMYFLYFNFGSAFFQVSSYHIYYCICNKFGQQVTKLETIELHVAQGKIVPFYLSFIAESELREIIDQYDALIIDVIMLDVTLPKVICTEMETVDGSVKNNQDTDNETPCNSVVRHKLYKDGSTSDLILFVKGQKFFVHKIVLASKSPTFSVTLLPKLSKNQVMCITIDDFDPAVVAKMLGYMYFNSVSNIDDIVFDLYRIAEKFHLGGLMKICVTCLVKNITVDNAMTIFVFAVKNDIKELIENTKAVIASNVDRVLDSDGFKRMINCYDFENPGL